jgi:hypothetical protein
LEELFPTILNPSFGTQIPGKIIYKNPENIEAIIIDHLVLYAVL